MDPITHAAIGAVCAQSVSWPRKVYASSALVALLGAMAPDLDVFVALSYAQSDNLALFKMHRHITHSIFFAPIGAWLVTIASYTLLSLRISFRRAYVFSLLGYLSHLFADWCTGYGMYLFAPISDMRVSGHICSPLSPFLSLPLWYMAYKARRFESRHIARFGLAFFLLYVGFAAVQRDKVISFVKKEHPEAHNIVPDSSVPFMWRVAYIDNDKIFVDSHLVLRLVRKQQSVEVPYQSLERVLSQERYAQHRELLRFFYKFFNDLVYICGNKVYILCWSRYYRLAVDDVYMELVGHGQYKRHHPSVFAMLRDLLGGGLQSESVPMEAVEAEKPLDKPVVQDQHGRKKPRLKKFVSTNASVQRVSSRARR